MLDSLSLVVLLFSLLSFFISFHIAVASEPEIKLCKEKIIQESERFIHS